jgi:hypothetical protein
MHTRFATEIELPASANDVWSCLADMTTWHEWTDVFDVRGRAPSPTWTPGATFVVGPKILGRRLWADVEIIECEPTQSLVWAGTVYGIPGRHGFEFAAVSSDRCLMTQWEECGGFGGRLAVLSGAWSILERRFEDFNRDLREHLASGVP